MTPEPGPEGSAAFKYQRPDYDAPPTTPSQLQRICWRRRHKLSEWEKRRAEELHTFDELSTKQVTELLRYASKLGIATAQFRSDPPDQGITLADLKREKRWVAWRIEMRNGKPTKVPFCSSKREAESDNPNTWLPFDEAEACASALTHQSVI
jgi:hypothetical protein